MAGDVADGVDADVDDDGDVHGDVRRCGVYAGGSGGADGDAGDVHRGVVTVPTIELATPTGVTYAVDPPGPYDAGHRGLHGDGDGDVGRRLGVGTAP